jgi:hypothetical protein
MGARVVFATLAFWLVAAGEAMAQAWGPAGAPEIDGPAGVAAVAFLVSVGLIAYNRFKK